MAGRRSGPEILAFSVLQFGSIAKCEPAWGGCPTLENVQEKTFFFSASCCLSGQQSAYVC